MVSPHLRSLCIIYHCYDKIAFQLGSRCVKINKVNFSDLLEIIGQKSANLEEFHIDAQSFCYDCLRSPNKERPDAVFEGRFSARELMREIYSIYYIVKNNPNFWTLSVLPRLEKEKNCTPGLLIPSLKEFTLIHPRWSHVKTFFSLTEKLSAIELQDCMLLSFEIPMLIEEIIKQKT